MSSEDPAPRAAPRRVVTGRSATGAAVFTADGPAEMLAGHLVPPGIEEVWGSDGPVPVPNDGAPRGLDRYFPSAGGYRVRVITFRPDGSAPLTPTQTEEIGRLLVGVHEDADWDPDRPGMHATRSVDIGHVLEGSVVLELDGGESTTLHAGDWFVQNGTRHAWRNPSAVPCRVLILMIGAEPAGDRG